MDRIIVYGCGRFFEKHKEEIIKKYNVIGYVDSKVSNVSVGGDKYPVLKDLFEVEREWDMILVMIDDIPFIFDVISRIIYAGIEDNRIIIGKALYGKCSSYDHVCADGEGNIVLQKNQFRITVTNADEWFSVDDIFLNECYSYSIPGNLPEIVIDIGMNIGDSTLFFAGLDKIEKVYGYEPFAETYYKACKNLENEEIEGKVEIYNIGIGDSNRTQVVSFFDGMSTGLSTISENTLKSRDDRLKMGRKLSGEAHENDVIIREASDVVKEILSRHGDHKHYILKMDCEGEEYSIFENLNKNALLESFSFILVEWHNEGSDMLKEYLDKAGFFFHSVITELDRDRGMIYAVNKKVWDDQ